MGINYLHIAPIIFLDYEIKNERDQVLGRFAKVWPTRGGFLHGA